MAAFLPAPQLARHTGATVDALVSRPEHLDAARELGAKDVWHIPADLPPPHLHGRTGHLLHRPPGTPPVRSSPLADAFADVWRRMAHGMSRRWQQRTAQHWIEYLAANLTEAADRQVGPRSGRRCASPQRAVTSRKHSQTFQPQCCSR
ncbi:terpene synthase family protein [Streptomyces goshikiensis]|uniref:terpene synthase family protein n=1 Tax=Streptomyces goshikiensis TaxID=1942 RepID=UPI003697C9D8